MSGTRSRWSARLQPRVSASPSHCIYIHLDLHPTAPSDHAIEWHNQTGHDCSNNDRPHRQGKAISSAKCGMIAANLWLLCPKTARHPLQLYMIWFCVCVCCKNKRTDFKAYVREQSTKINKYQQYTRICTNII